MILSVGESKPKCFRPASAIIKAVEMTDHTHSFVSWRDPRNNIRVVAEARGSGCRIVTNHTFKAENEVVRIFQYEIDEQNLIEFEKYVWEQMGRPYGHKHLIGLLLMRTGVTESNPFRDGECSQICVELSVRAISHAMNIPIPKHIENWGLREAHRFNMMNYKEQICDMASPEKIRRINGVSA